MAGKAAELTTHPKRPIIAWRRSQTTPTTRTARITGFLALQRSTVGLLAMVVLVGMGERMAERFLPIYLMALGGGAMSIGLLSGLDNLLSALYSFPGAISPTASGPSGRCWCST